MILEDDRQSALSQQHDAFTRLLHEFYEWRHKIMTRFAILVGAFILGLNSLIQKNVLDYWLALVFLLGGGFAFIAACLDRVNQDLIEICYTKGRLIESQLGIADVGIFHALRGRFNKPKETALARLLGRGAGVMRSHGWLSYSSF